MSLLSESGSAIYYYYHLIRINSVHFLLDRDLDLTEPTVLNCEWIKVLRIVINFDPADNLPIEL